MKYVCLTFAKGLCDGHCNGHGAVHEYRGDHCDEACQHTENEVHLLRCKCKPLDTLTDEEQSILAAKEL